jgi:hypothetical protein
VYNDLKDGKPEEKLAAMEKLSLLAKDPTFSMEFIQNNGQDLIKQFVQDGRL